VVHFDIDRLKTEHQDLETKTVQEEFWNDPETAQKVLRQVKHLKDKIEFYESMVVERDELQMLADMALDEKDYSVEKDIVTGVEALEQKVETLELETLLSGEFDQNSCILSIHAGTGGTDAQDWASMLMRMFTRWAEAHGFRVRILDLQRDEEAGIKSTALEIDGVNAYGYLKSEKGVHRLVRISPFDSSGKRHTSFASVDVMPMLDEEITVEIDTGDLRIDTFRASGAGGQHVNMTDSAVRITHLPTGIVVQCQNERSQISNRATAMRMLAGKLLELKEREHKERIEDLAGDYSQIAWGSQIRSYVFNPYNLVKDHRTGVEVGNVYGVMDGDLDVFIQAYLKENSRKS
jgi:peptide chain release factor 2